MVYISQITLPDGKTYDIRDNSPAVQSVDNLPQDIASFDGAAALPLSSLKIAINPIQDLHGYGYPWIEGAGKNKLQVTGTTQTINGVTFTVNNDGTIIVNGTATADARFVIGEYILKAGSSVRLNGSPVDGSTSTIALGYRGYGIVSTANSDRVCDRTSQSTDWDNDVYIAVTSGYTANNLVFKPMIRLSSVTDSTFAPYENICPISGHTEVNVTVADDVNNPTVSNVYTIDLNGTRYGGTLDVVSGVLVVDRVAKVFDGSEDWSPNGNKGVFIRTSNIPNIETSKTFITDVYKTVPNGEAPPDGCINYNSARNAIQIHDERAMTTKAYKTLLQTNPVQLVYELATPITYQLTPAQVKSLLDSNNIWADTGEVLEAKYVVSKYDGITAKISEYANESNTAINSQTVNNHTVNKDVPSDAVFTDTTYTATGNIDISQQNVISRKEVWLDSFAEYEALQSADSNTDYHVPSVTFGLLPITVVNGKICCHYTKEVT